MELGKINRLNVQHFGDKMILTDGKDTLPFQGEKGRSYDEGEVVEAFLYKENSGKLSATTKTPYIQVGELAVLKIVSKTKIGYFVDIGMPKDILLPFSETTERVREGESYLMYMYVDKSERLALTMQIKNHLLTDSPYKKNDTVRGTVYHNSPTFGVLVAVDEKYDGLIPWEMMKGIVKEGEEIEARVQNVLPDGKLTLTLRDPAHIQMKEDSEELLGLIKQYKGTLPVGDKSPADEILDITGLSKSAFKRAVGKLYKEGKAIPGAEQTKIKR